LLVVTATGRVRDDVPQKFGMTMRLFVSALLAVAFATALPQRVDSTALWHYWSINVANDSATCAWITIDAGAVSRHNIRATIVKSRGFQTFTGEDDENIKIRAQFYRNNDCSGGFVADRYDLGIMNSPASNNFKLKGQGESYVMVRVQRF
jgi:hypothetical protein